MTQWFRGQLEGHYVGTSAGRPAESKYGAASRYKIRIYRALIRDIEVLERPGQAPGEDGPAAPGEPPVALPEDCFYQAEIADTRLLGIRPRSCFEGSVYDVSVSKLRVTHSTIEGGKTYGRLEGEIYGRYLLPPQAEADEAAQVMRELTAAEAAVEPGSEEALTDTLAASAAAASADHEEPLHPPTLPAEVDPDEPARPPLILLGVMVAALLGLAGGATAALLWLAVLVPILLIRFMIAGMYKINNVQRVIGVLLVMAQLGCLSVLGLEWWTTGCKATHVIAMSGIMVTLVASSLLASPIPLLSTGAGLALVLTLWFGNTGRYCELAGEPLPGPAAEPGRPSVTGPGVPRTNEDGSWPRRRPSAREPQSTP